MLRATLKKPEILRGKRNFDTIFERGVRVRASGLQAIVLALPANGVSASGRATEPSVKMAALVPKSAGNAVFRNRIKRLIREAYRLRKNSLPAAAGRTLNIVFLWSPRKSSAERITLVGMQQEIESLLLRIREQFT